MDTSDPEIVFNEQGVCNHCHQYDARAARELMSPEERQRKLDALVETIKASGRGKEYDCILGVSGGADSSYVAYLAKKLGLRPLAVHFDNGWNSELAVDNIKRILSALDIDLYTLVVDWDEFCDLQKSFLKASVPNAEIPTDHAITALLWNTAHKHGIRYILSGMNLKTEGVMPLAWTYTANDLFHLRSIHKRFGSRPLRTLPKLGLFQFAWYVFAERLRVINLLNFFDYDKAQAIQILEKEVGYRPYPEKHYESVWTRFYQGAFLVDKFGFDKRLPHMASLVVSGQMSRDEALRRLDSETYPESLRRQDYDFVLKKFGMSEAEYDALLKEAPQSHLDYPNLSAFYLRSSRLQGWFKRIAKAS
jgi:N-acetyl sugar amidotransferase